MASVTALHCISKGSYGGILGTETRTSHGSRIPSLKSQATGFEGLRSRNVVDSIRLRTNAKATTSRQNKRAAAAAGTSTYPVVICGKGMNIVFVGAEMAPWSKTGGLGDVLGGLPPYMAANGHRVMAVAPRYDQYYDGWDTSVVVDIKVGNNMEKVRFFHCHKRGVDRVFVDHPKFLEKVWGKTESLLYGPTPGVDYDDNQLRYSILCQAALIAPLALQLNNNPYHSGTYGDNVMFIANDWHTGPLAGYLKSMYQSRGIYKNAKVVFCIHNIVYQGRFAASEYKLLNLPERFRPSFEFNDGYEKPVKGGKINWMKAGINESDRVATVSPYYARELVSGEDRGVELHRDLMRTGVTGIVNGMDTIEWDPTTDKYINCNYDARTVREARPLNKEALQAQVGLPVDRNIPLIAFLGRLEEQKGSDILAAAIPGFMDENCQVLVLGTGKKDMERQLAELEAKYPNKVRTHFKFNVPLAHAVMAGADYLIITSRFEPCGLIQLQGMRYGLPSICASTGGLVDTIKEGFTGFHMGAFSVNCDRVDEREVQNVVSTVKRAISFYRTPGFAQMIQNCMHQDLSWKGPAKKWEDLLLGLGAPGSEPGVEGEEIAPRASENVANP